MYPRGLILTGFRYIYIAVCRLPILRTETMAFSKTSKDISLDGTLLRAQCIDGHGESQDSEIDLNQYIANVNGTLKWKANGNFVKSSKSITVEGSVLKCKTRNKFHQWHQAELDLDEKIANCNGRLVYGFQRAIIAVNEHNVEEVTQYIKGVYEANKDEVITQVAEGADYKVGIYDDVTMMTSSNGNIFRATGPL